MKEKIIFSNINQYALLRLLAQKGIDNLGYRVFNANNIISYIREKTVNLSNKELISSKEKASLYNKFLHDNDTYFKGAAYEDAKQLSSTIDTIRSLILDNEEKEIEAKLVNDKVFKDKYEAIYKIYRIYIDYLNNNNKTDLINEARELISENNKIDSEVLIIKGENNTPLTIKLLESCFTSVKEIEYIDLFNAKHSAVEFKHLYRAKGYVHEISNIFKIIIENKLPLDKCTIVYTNYNNYYNSIKEYSDLFSLPVTYIDGIPSTEFNAYRMLYLITKLHDGLYGYNSLMNLIKDKSFNYDKLIQDVGVTKYLDTFLEEIGDLKFRFDKEYNEHIFNQYIIGNTSHVEEIRKFKNIFNLGVVNLIKEFSVFDDPYISNKLINNIEAYKKINNIEDFDYYKSIINSKLKSTIAKEGTITVCSINSVRENVRDYMFFVGNDNDSFHISLAENCYISDNKLLEFDKNCTYTSINNATHKRNNFKDAIHTAYDLGADIYVSYTEKDEVDLKKHNFVSLLYDLHTEYNPNEGFEDFKKRFVQTNTYFGNNLRSDEKIIEAYLNKTNLINKDEVPEENEETINDLLKIRYSPTQIEQNMNCRKRFLIEKILNINTEEQYDVFNKFANTDLGDMFHKTMKFANDNKTRQDVLDEAKRIFDATVAKRNPILDYELSKDRDEFLDIVENGYKYISKKQKGIAEHKQEPDIDINGKTLLLKGIPDLVSGNEIIDYKAKRHITHKDNDKETCIQALIYALMNSDRNIDHVEYYYPIFNRIIKTNYVENDIRFILNQFIDSLESNDFKAAKDVLVDQKEKSKLKTICQYCNFKDICGKEQ